MNQLLESRGLAPLTEQRYKQIFTFPVQKYYELAGFDFSREPFETPAMEYMDIFFKKLPQVGLFYKTTDVLNRIKQLNIKQIILSAMEQKALVESVNALGIGQMFENIYGCGDHYAKGKAEQGIELMSQLGVNSNQVLLIGDTLHDYEVAKHMGCKCLLMSHGHQNAERLSQSHCPIIASFEQLVNLI